MSKRIVIAAVALASAFAAVPARAVDGCTVLLCLAGPWQSIGECVAPVEQLFADLWNGDPFPGCSNASAPRGHGRQRPAGRQLIGGQQDDRWLEHRAGPRLPAAIRDPG